MDWDHRPNEREGRGESKSRSEEQEIHGEQDRDARSFQVGYSFDTHRQVHSHVGEFEDRAVLRVRALLATVHDNMDSGRSEPCIGHICCTVDQGGLESSAVVGDGSCSCENVKYLNIRISFRVPI